ncbi:MAG TPA: FapA family protein [Bordetella sp.]
MSDSTPVELVVDDETRVLSAVYQPMEGAPPPTLESLRHAVRNRGWTEAVLADDMVALFLQACADESEPVRLPVGALLDGSFELHVDRNRMSAMLTVEPPRGGAAVTEEQVRAALAAQGMVAGILDDVLRRAVERGTGEAVCIAEGRDPTPGKPASFENLIESPRDTHAEEIVDEDDSYIRIDYRDMGSLALVKPGDPLMRRAPAVPGTPGFDLTGRVIEPRPVQDTPFADGLTGAAPAEDDPNLLIATISGAPKIMSRGVSVNSLVEIESVNLDTGNIELDGTLRVKGDITMGMKVRVSGDVFVNGTIEAAEVHADGNITVNGGIIGMTQTVSNDGQEQSRAARLSCGGTVKARFISNAEINAGQIVAVEREVRQSIIDAGASVVVGPPGTQNGVITGGRIRAMKSVQAGSLGSMSSALTEVHVGMDPHAHVKRAALQQKHKDMVDQKEKLEKLVMFLHANPQKNVNGVGDRARETLKKIIADVAALEVEEVELNKALEPLADAYVATKKRIYSGVTLYIGSKVREFREDRPGCKAMLDKDGEIALN